MPLASIPLELEEYFILEQVQTQVDSIRAGQSLNTQAPCPSLEEDGGLDRATEQYVRNRADVGSEPD